MARLVKEVRAKQPKLIVVDRAVPGEQQNYLTPEQHIPETGLPYPWETCMTMGNSWSYVPNDIYKPANEIIEKLVDIVSKGGNYLLNIGPSPEGEFDPAAYQRLKEIGEWMKINSEAIYSTRMFSVFGEGEKIRFTQSKDGKTRFIFLFDFPSDKLVLTKIPFGKTDKVQLLGNNKNISWKQTAQGVEMILPAELKTVTNHVWVLKVKN
jgi:alpha-L-fucosidase